jgi:hypothetical protein
MMKSMIARLAGALLAMTVAAQSAQASPCGTDAADLPDTALWANHGCWWDFVLWQYKAYRMFNGDWGSWGFDDACNVNKPYPKAWNASYLLTYGLPEDNWQWHGTIDYRRAGEAYSSVTHGQTTIKPANTRDWLAQARGWPNNDVRMSCLLFDDDAWSNSPTTRAADYIHEGWHHWQNTRNYNGHMDGPIGACTMGAGGCDWYYWHGVGAYAFGEAHKYTSDGRFFHSPNQIQVEFLCDIADKGQWWLPTIIGTRAVSEANNRLANRFRNAVGYRCGDPRPW